MKYYVEKTSRCFKGHLKLGQYKIIDCEVFLVISEIKEDKWLEKSEEINFDEFVDGLKITGCLYFDTSPIFDNDHPVQRRTIGELSLIDYDENSSLFNIYLIECSKKENIIDSHLKRYFWDFLPIGKPVRDKIGIFPQNYRGKKEMNRVFSCVNFRGNYWDENVASVIVASDKTEARKILEEKLKSLKVPLTGEDFILNEIDLDVKFAYILAK